MGQAVRKNAILALPDFIFDRLRRQSTSRTLNPEREALAAADILRRHDGVARRRFDDGIEDPDGDRAGIANRRVIAGAEADRDEMVPIADRPSGGSDDDVLIGIWVGACGKIDGRWRLGQQLSMGVGEAILWG